MRRRLQRGFAGPALWLVSLVVASSCSGPASPASTEAPTPALTTRPQTVVSEEGMLFQDEFANPESGWPIVDVDNYRFGYHPPDFYHVEVKAPNDTLSVFRGVDFGDVSVETTALVDHTDTETGGYRYGLALRRSGEQYYAFTVSPRAGAWTILKHSATGVEVLAEGPLGALQGVAPPGVTPDKLDTLRVDAVGPNFAFTINGQDVARVSDTDYASGDVGFFVETFDESLAHVHYDSLKIREPEGVEGVLYQDGFTSPESGWPKVDFDNYRFGYHPPDFYHVEVKAPNDTLSVFRGMDFQDVSVETTALVDHTDTETGGYRYGLALRRSGEQYYAFTVSPRAGTWTILKHSATGVEVLAEGPLGALQGVAPPGVTPDKLDTLRVDAVGPNFAFTINGQDITRVSDTDYASGDVGFFVETFDESLAHVHYDSLAIRTPQAVAAVETIPTAVPATPVPTPASTPATLPADPDVLVETVLNDVVEKANNAEVDAILSGDENDIELWWKGKAFDRVVSGIRSIRSRFTQVTEVSWTRSGEWIRVLSNTDTQATYATSETWTFVGAIDQQCPDGSQTRRRYVESYPSQQYTLELKDGAYHIVEWQLGRTITSDISTFCP